MPDNKSVANSNKTAGEAVSKCSTPCCKVPKKVPEKGKKVPLDKNNQKFIDDANKYFDDQIKVNQSALADYQKKKWPADNNSRQKEKTINDLTAQKKKFNTVISSNQWGDDFFTLANVIYNETGTSNSAAKNAVAHAYLNRINKGNTGTVCTVREPKKDPKTGKQTEISNYRQHNRSFGTITDKQSFLNSYIPSMEAAKKRLGCETSDPTCGATHWVSPGGLKEPGKDKYKREFNGKIRYFPKWAISNDAYSNKTTKEKSASWNPDYKEFTVLGVDSEDFLFYKGVK